MATDVSSTPVNGNYGPHGGYDQNATGYGSNANSASYNGTTPSSTAPTSNPGTSEIPKDEVGWYFVEQYYTTLSRSPDKLYLFYNKRSQFVLGQEADKVAVCVGQKSINERIKELDFRDCKVRVTNVDSQASDANIVIQVIGEMSNKSQPHKKFTQTFVLAGQTNGYFVLNDIFRFIVDEEEEPEAEKTQRTAVSSGFQEPAPTATDTEIPETMTSSHDASAIEDSASKVDEALESKVVHPDLSQREPPPPNRVNGDAAPAESELVQAEEAPVAAPLVEDEPEPATQQDVQAQVPEAEKPKAPEPTPSVSPAKQTAQPAAPVETPSAPSASAPAPSKPSAPKTWANLAAAAHRVTPAVPAPQQNSSATPQQNKAAPAQSPASAATSAPSAAPTSAAAAPRDASPARQDDEWTSVGDNKKQQSKAQAGAAAQEGPSNRAYIKNVHEGIDIKELRSTLEKFGELTYFDISKQKNCAFVDFKTADGYKAAVEANPHEVGNERVVVEERRMKPGNLPFAPRGGARGGRGGQAQGRGSFQGRGGFAGRGRGGPAARGRGGAQAA